jgi:UrcA family protein
MMSIKTPAASIAVLCVASITASVALAAEAPSVKVEVTRPLDPAHAAQLYQRIQSAARQVCEPLDSPDLELRIQYRRCVDEAIARAVSDVRWAEVTKIHLAEQAAASRE